MKRFFGFCALFCAVLAAASSANAGVLGSGLTFNGQEDTLIDNSVGLLHDIDGNNVLSVGDVIQGVIQFDHMRQDGTTDINTNDRLYAVYSYEVSSASSGTSVGSVFNFKAATGGYALSNVLSASGFSTAGMHNTLAGTLADATIAVFETNSSASLANFTAGAPAAFASRILTGGAIGGQISAAGGWTLEAVSGLVGDDFFQTQVNRSMTVPEIRSPTTSNSARDIMSYETAQSVLLHNLGGSTVFLPLLADKLDGSGTAIGDIVTSGNNGISYIRNVAGSNNDARDDGWDFEDRGNFNINVIPEPSSIFAFGSLGAFFAAAIRKRRKNA